MSLTIGLLPSGWLTRLTSGGLGFSEAWLEDLEVGKWVFHCGEVECGSECGLNREAENLRFETAPVPLLGQAGPGA